jgi:photosystem II stability/assembly factor-like uncharacterized protein
MQRGHAGKIEELLYAGTVGQGVQRSRDGGEHWEALNFGLPPHSNVRALAVHPQQPNRLIAGTDQGCFRSQDGGLSWKPIRTIDEAIEVWSLCVCPQAPELLCVGTRPGRVYCSRDGGSSWMQLPIDLPPASRVTAIAVDPEDLETLYIGVEVGGLLRSVDGGRRWEPINEGLSDLDIHGLCVSASSPPTLHVATASDIFRSQDWGEHWQPVRLKERWPLTYTRAIVVAPDNDRVIYAGAGLAPSGEVGGLYRSPDLGDSWAHLDVDVVPGSTIWTIAMHPSQPRRIFAGTLRGQLLRTLDGGRMWQEVQTPFEELRVLLCVAV